MPHAGDELHHFGWNACASCHGERARRFLVVPGLLSGRIHVIDTADPRRPAFHKVIEPKEVAAKAKLTGPHTVHCLPDGQIMISMLGDENGDAPGGFLLLDDRFEVAGRWEASREGMRFNYDFWFQPRHNVMVSSEWAALNTVRPGFKPDDVKAGRYGRRLQVWDWDERRIAQSLDLGDDGLLPLEVRFHHDPSSTHGFVGVALSSAVWHWFKDGDAWKVEKVIQVAPRGQGPGCAGPRADHRPRVVAGRPLAVFLRLAPRRRPSVRRERPVEASAGRATVAGRRFWRGAQDRGAELNGGPQMLQLSLDGKRLYVTNSLFASWDDQFYPQIGKKGSYLVQVDCDTERGGMALNERFLVDFGKEPDGPARAHEVRFPGGDSTSDIWV